MKAFVLSSCGWLFILFAHLTNADGVFAGGLMPFFFFLAALICSILGILSKQQRGWNLAALILLSPPIVAMAVLVVGGVILGS